MRIAGFDPSFTNVGWVAVEYDGAEVIPVDGGVIRSKPSAKKLRVRMVDDNVRRTKEMAREVRDVIDGCAIVCVEGFQLGQKGTRHSAAKQATGSAIITVVAEMMRKPMLQVTAQEIRAAVVGKQGRAISKDEVAKNLIALYPVFGVILARLPKTKREHCADAFAAVLACLDTDEARLCLAAASANLTSRK